jgi:large subunit ribosomal protein L9
MVPRQSLRLVDDSESNGAARPNWFTLRDFPAWAWNKGSFFLTHFGGKPKSLPPIELLPLIPMANAQVILKEKIEGLGAEADVVKVRAGYARNFLIPQGKAFEASKSNLRHVEALKVSRARREAEELVGYQELATKISKLKPKFVLSTGQGGKAFGSVTSIDIHKELEAAGIIIDRHAIQLEKPVKKSGKTEVEIRLHPQVTTMLVISVDAGEEEAAG